MTPALRGVVLMTAGISCLSIMDAAVKWLVVRDVTPVQLIAVRGWIITFALIIGLCVIARTGGVTTLITPNWRLHLYRSLGGVFAPLCFFLSLKYLPLADAVTIFFSNIFLMTAGSVWFLNERVGIHRWSAVVVGFIGVVIVVQPGTTAFHPASLLVIIAGISYSGLLISGRWLSRTESMVQLVFYFTFFNTIICSILLLLFWSQLWHEMQWFEVKVLLGLSAIALTGYFFMTKAFSVAPISVIAPFEYLALPWAIGIGFLVWGETPQPIVWVGIVLILSAGLYIAWREARHGS